MNLVYKNEKAFFGIVASSLIIGCSSLLMMASHAIAQEANEAAETAKPATENSAEAGGAATFVLLQDSGFGAFMVDKGNDFSPYRNVILFPTKISSLEISMKGNRDAAHSWRKADEEELGQIAGFADQMVEKVFKRNGGFDITDSATGETLAVQVRLEEFFPMMKRPDDASNNTIGSSQTKSSLGIMKINAVIVDAQQKRMIGVIEDVLVLDSRQSHRNTRSNQARIWRHAFENWAKKLEEALTKLRSTGIVSG